MVIDHDAALQFLTTAYRPDDWIAVFLKSYQSPRVAQRIAPMSVVISPRVQAWLARENREGVDVFVSVNTLAPRMVSRRRSAVAAIRHVFLDADEDGSGVVAAIGARHDLPSPSYVLHSSAKRVHVFWRVAGFTRETVEALQQQLAGELHADRAATSCAQTTRLAGFWNQKRVPPSLVRVEYRDIDLVYTPADFPNASVIDVVRSSQRPSRPRLTTHRVRERARRYAAALPPAIAGQHGDVHTFRLCCRLVRGFALSEEEALAVLKDWNARCEPPWSERELTAKVRHAWRYGREPVGGLLETQP
jgi:hypothetical protein